MSEYTTKRLVILFNGSLNIVASEILNSLFRIHIVVLDKSE